MLALAATSLAGVLFLKSKPSPPVLKFAVTQPENTSFPGMPSVSPDGRYLTFSAVGPEGKRMLWLRPLDALRATIIQGSEGASSPFWSPDSRQIAFFGGKDLKRVRITGGTPEIICDADANPGGGAWNGDGTILFAPSLYGGLWRVASTGGKPAPMLNLDDAKQERADLWPQFLPDGRHFVFYQQTDDAETSGVYLGTLDSPQYKLLFFSQTNAVYSPESADSTKSGYLLFINDRSLMAQPFNAGKQETTEAAFKLADDIGAVQQHGAGPALGVGHRCTGLPGSGPGDASDDLDGSAGETDRGGGRARYLGSAAHRAGRQQSGRGQDRTGWQDGPPVDARTQRRGALN